MVKVASGCPLNAQTYSKQTRSGKRSELFDKSALLDVHLSLGEHGLGLRV